MAFDRDLHVVADRVTNPADRLEAGFELRRGDELAAIGERDLVERPDLHRHDPLGHEIPRQSIGIGAKVEDVVVARVVGADALARAAPEQAVDGLAGRFAGEIPQRQIDGAQRPHLRARPAVIADGEEQIVPEPFAIARILPEQGSRERLVHDRFRRRRCGVGLPESDQPLVGVQAHPEPSDRPGVHGERAVEDDRLDTRDAHMAERLERIERIDRLERLGTAGRHETGRTDLAQRAMNVNLIVTKPSRCKNWGACGRPATLSTACLERLERVVRLVRLESMASARSSGPLPPWRTRSGLVSSVTPRQPHEPLQPHQPLQPFQPLQPLQPLQLGVASRP